MQIDIGDGFHLTEVREGDQAAYVENFRDKEITDFMILIPYPYTQEHADFWVRHCLEMSRQQPHPSEFAIRRPMDFSSAASAFFWRRTAGGAIAANSATG